MDLTQAQELVLAQLDEELSRGNPDAVAAELAVVASHLADLIDMPKFLRPFKDKIATAVLRAAWKAIPDKYDMLAVPALQTLADVLKSGGISFGSKEPAATGRRFAILSNVSQIDKNVYGNTGKLPGVKKDRDNWSQFFASQQFEVVADNFDSTKRQFADSVRQIAMRAETGDLVVIQHSGHGSQVPDKSGDESDGQDEVLCFYDGTLEDDVVYNLLVLFKPGVQVVLITDTCHSGTMFRTHMLDRLVEMTKPRAVASSALLNCSLVAIGTCSDEQTAADTSRGGAGSQALLSAFSRSRSYHQWVTDAQAWLRGNRYEQLLSLNAVNADAMLQQRPLSGLGGAVSSVVGGAVTPQSLVRLVTVLLADGSSVRLEPKS